MLVELKKNMFGGKRIGTILGGILATGRVANAYLFVGSNQTEIKVVAHRFAKALNCNSKVVTPCDTCLNCKLISAAKFVDVINVSPDGASIKIDQIREIKSLVKYGPSQGKYQVIIINAADKMTTEAANSFLKILEEPAGGVVFILTAASPFAILPTVKSRCHQIVFPEISIKIADGHTFDSLTAKLIAKDVVALFLLSKKLAKDKTTLENTLFQFMLYCRKRFAFQTKRLSLILKIIMDTIKCIKRKASNQMALDAMFIKLMKEV